MENFVAEFDDGKLHEPLLGERQIWEPGQWANGTDKPPWYDGWGTMASANKEAADHLVDWLADRSQVGPMCGTDLTYPIMSLYRHYLELRLKGLQNDLEGWEKLVDSRVGESDGEPRRRFNHQLTEVWKTVRRLLYKVDADELAIEGVREETDDKYDAIEERIKEFSDIDARATTFRYPEEKNGEPTLGAPLGVEELLQVKSVVDALEFYLAGIRCGVSETISKTLEVLVTQGKCERGADQKPVATFRVASIYPSPVAARGRISGIPVVRWSNPDRHEEIPCGPQHASWATESASVCFEFPCVQLEADGAGVHQSLHLVVVGHAGHDGVRGTPIRTVEHRSVARQRRSPARPKRHVLPSSPLPGRPGIGRWRSLFTRRRERGRGRMAVGLIR